MHTLQVGFRYTTVAVETDSDYIATHLRTAFRHMPGTAAQAVVGNLRLVREGDTYRCHGAPWAAASGLTEQSAADHATYEVIMHLRYANGGLLWLHAACAARGSEAVVFAGNRGSGKSTLAALLPSMGWRYLSDDVTPIEMPSLCAVPFPETPSMRLGGPAHLEEPEVLLLSKAIVELHEAQIAREPVGISALVFPAYVAGSATTLERVGPGRAAAALLQQCLDLPNHEKETVECVGRLLTRAPAWRMTYSVAHEAARAMTARLLPGEQAEG
ncbi:MAG: hypothetical protein NT029_20315 [Armatimonadetes bacterium]|nr:hypothetical protein [Armatimonadota bacterium]